MRKAWRLPIIAVTCRPRRIVPEIPAIRSIVPYRGQYGKRLTSENKKCPKVSTYDHHGHMVL